MELQHRQLETAWHTDPRWSGVTRGYRPTDVSRLRGSRSTRHVLAHLGASRLWNRLRDAMNSEPYVGALCARTGNQALEQVAVGLDAIYVSTRPMAGVTQPPSTHASRARGCTASMPELVRLINRTLLRAEQEHAAEFHPRPGGARAWLAPLVAEAEAGFGGPLHTFELMKSMIHAGAAGVCFEDHLASGGKHDSGTGTALVPTRQIIDALRAARLAADVCGVPSVIIAQTHAGEATLLRSPSDPADHPFLTGERTAEGYFPIAGGEAMTLARGLAVAPYADLIGYRCTHLDLEQARRFAAAIHARFPHQLLAFRWDAPCSIPGQGRDTASLGHKRRQLAAMGYRFQCLASPSYASPRQAARRAQKLGA